MESTRFPPYDADFDLCALQSEPLVMYVKFIHDTSTNKALFRFVFEYFSRQVNPVFESASNKITSGKFEYLVPASPFYMVNVKLCRGFRGEERFHKEEWLPPKDRNNVLVNHETRMRSELLGRYKVHVQTSFHHHYRRGHTETIFSARAVHQGTGRIHVTNFDITAHHTDYFPVLKQGPATKSYSDESDPDPDSNQNMSRSRRDTKRSRKQSGGPVSLPAWSQQMHEPVQTYALNQNTASGSNPAWTQQMQKMVQTYAINQNIGSGSQLAWTQQMQQPLQAYTMNQHAGSGSQLAWTQQMQQPVQAYTMNQNDSFAELPLFPTELQAPMLDFGNPLQFPVPDQPIFPPGAQNMTQKYQIPQNFPVTKELDDLPADEELKPLMDNEETALW